MPAVVDLAAMRDAMAEMGGDPAQINPLVPAELVIDHSVQVDAFGTRDAFRVNAEREFERNQRALRVPALGPGRVRRLRGRAAGHRHRPPGQPRVPRARRVRRTSATGQAYPDTLVGTDSHTTMVNGLGVLGWGVGGIEAEAAMLGQPMSMLIPQVLGFRLHGELPEGATATDLVLTVTEMLRERGVVGHVRRVLRRRRRPALPLADRATIGNMSPEFGSTCAIFPIDAETLRYLSSPGRPPEQIALVEAYAQGAGPVARRALRAADLLATRSSSTSRASSRASPAPSARRTASPLSARAGGLPRGAAATSCPTTARRPTRTTRRSPSPIPPPTRRPTARPATSRRRDPQPAASPTRAPRAALPPQRRARRTVDARRRERRARPRRRRDRRDHELHEHVEPVGDGRRRACSRATPSRAACAQAVGEDLARARLEGRHRVPRPRRPDRAARGARLQPRRLRLHDLHRQLRAAARGGLRGRRRGRPRGRLGALGQPQLRGAHQPRREDELPRLAAAVRRLRARRDDGHRPRRTTRSGADEQGNDVYLRDIWPSEQEIARDDRRGRAGGHVPQAATARCSTATSAGTRSQVPAGERFAWDAELDLRAPAAVLRGTCPPSPRPSPTCAGARVLALLGDTVTTDHISPAGSIKRDGPAGALPAGAGRRAARLQLLRRAARQPRGDDARHLRQHPPAQPARRPARGRLPRSAASRATSRRAAPSRCRSTTRRCATSQEGVPLRRARRQGVRLGLLARLGREGHAAARRARGDRRELRAHPPLEPRRHGRAAAAVPRRARAPPRSGSTRRGGVLDRRASPTAMRRRRRRRRSEVRVARRARARRRR